MPTQRPKSSVMMWNTAGGWSQRINGLKMTFFGDCMMLVRMREALSHGEGMLLTGAGGHS